MALMNFFLCLTLYVFACLIEADIHSTFNSYLIPYLFHVFCWFSIVFLYICIIKCDLYILFILCADQIHLIGLVLSRDRFYILSIKAHVIFPTPASTSRRSACARNVEFILLFFMCSCIPIPTKDCSYVYTYHLLYCNKCI